MAYTKPDQSRFNLLAGQFIVMLDTGEYVLITQTCSVEPNSGNPVVKTEAIVVDGQFGLPNPDANGQAIKAGFAHTSCQGELDTLGGMSALQRLCIMAVLGEDTTPFWKDAAHADFLLHVSIRTNLAAAAHAGPSQDLSALL